MKWIDEAAYACAVGWSGMGSVTVYVGGIRFYKPIHIGDLVDVRAGSPRHSELAQTTQCVTVFVALGEDGQPAAVEVWNPRSDEGKSLRLRR